MRRLILSFKIGLLFILFTPTISYGNLNRLNDISPDSLELRYSVYSDAFFEHIFYSRDYDSALVITQMGLREFKSNQNYSHWFFRLKGIYFDYISEDDSCIHYLSQSLAYSKKVNDLQLISSIYIDFGAFHFDRNHLDSSTYYYLRAVGSLKKSDDLMTMGIVHNNLGLIKMRQSQFKEAKDYFLESITNYNGSDSHNAPKKKISSYVNLSECLRRLGEYQLATAYCNKVSQWCQQSNDTICYAENMGTHGKILYDMENYHSSVDISMRAYDLVSDKAAKITLPLLYNLIQGYRTLTYYDSSLYFNQIALELSYETENKRYVMSCIENQYMTYELMGDYENAFLQLKQFLSMKNDDQSLAEFKIVQDMENKYQNEKKNQEIIFLQQKSEIQQLYVAILVIIIILCSMLAYIIFHKYQTRHKLEIMVQKEKNSEAVLMGQENERKRISIELHDSIGASLANTSMRISSYLDRVSHLEESDLLILKESVDVTCKEIRTISHDLAPYKIEKEGLKFAIEDLLSNLNDIQQTHFKSSISIKEGEIPLLSKSILYRIIQELTTNICKHAKASFATIRIECNKKEIIVQIHDDGTGS